MVRLSSPLIGYCLVGAGLLVIVALVLVLVLA